MLQEWSDRNGATGMYVTGIRGWVSLYWTWGALTDARLGKWSITLRPAMRQYTWFWSSGYEKSISSKKWMNIRSFFLALSGWESEKYHITSVTLPQSRANPYPPSSFYPPIFGVQNKDKRDSGIVRTKATRRRETKQTRSCADTNIYFHVMPMDMKVIK